MFTIQYYQNTVALLPTQTANHLLRVQKSYWHQITEIRLYSGCEPYLTLQGKTLSLSALGNASSQPITHTYLQQIFLHLCQYSAFSQENRLRQGFFTLQSGQRVGIAAEAKWSSGSLLQPENITSMNIRIARNCPLSQPECWDRLIYPETGLLICGAPGTGKTTVLRALAQRIAQKGFRCTVIDERQELFPVSVNGFCFAKPGCCNVYSDYPKATGMCQALRSLSPQILLCDEISGEAMAPLAESLNSGVGFISTVHAANLQQLQKKTQYQALKQLCGVEWVVFLSGTKPGEIEELVHVAT